MSTTRLILVLCGVIPFAASLFVTFVQSSSRVDRFDFVEITLKVANPPAGNSFTDAEVMGVFERYPESGDAGHGGLGVAARSALGPAWRK